ncbi:hypothetical protein HOLleu_04696 [Holothuria leucospilota]|uniref:Uncharacterized protein n=1 Tax=Holothuria leucospilota TaxID=206669 RepID=A0A9Q1CTL7_HOLLE|nr:hypothetical protein HOLleu_04696 [Holothuria leucospilota]
MKDLLLCYSWHLCLNIVLPLNEETQDILKDTFGLYLVLRNVNQADIVEEMEMAQAVMNQAKTKLISQVVKKNVIENIVPVVIALKQMDIGGSGDCKLCSKSSNVRAQKQQTNSQTFCLRELQAFKIRKERTKKAKLAALNLFKKSEES